MISTHLLLRPIKILNSNACSHFAFPFFFPLRCGVTSPDASPLSQPPRVWPIPAFEFNLRLTPELDSRRKEITKRKKNLIAMASNLMASNRNFVQFLVRALHQGSSPHPQAGGASLKKREQSCVLSRSEQVPSSEPVPYSIE